MRGWCPTLRDAVHNLSGHFKSRSQASGKRGREVDRHVPWVIITNHRITSHIVQIDHWSLGVGAKSKSRAERRAAPPSELHTISNGRRTPNRRRRDVGVRGVAGRRGPSDVALLPFFCCDRFGDGLLLLQRRDRHESGNGSKDRKLGFINSLCGYWSIDCDLLWR